MQALLDLPRLTTNIHSLRTFCDKLESYIRGLESLGHCQDSYGNLLVPVIFEKLPAEIRRNMTRDHGDSNWQLPTLREALKKEISIMEAGQPVERPEVHDATASFFAGSRSKPKVPNNKQSSTNYRPQSKVCPFCSGPHQANECRKVTSVTSRMEIVNQKRLCFNCLGNHQVSYCRSNFRCRHCRRKHHSSICNRQSAQSTPDARVTSTTTSESVTSGATGHSAILHSTTQPRPNVLLKTAVAQVCSDRCCADANILFDEGAQRSFITESMVEILQLERTGTDVVHLTTFGATTQNVRHIDTATVYLSTDNGDKIPINVLVVPQIAVPLHNLQRSVTSLPYLRGLKLAHPVTDDESFEISLLVGADKYWEIVQNHVIRGDGPTAVKSKIGYLLSGPLPVASHHTSMNCIMNIISSPPETCDLERFWKLESLGINPTTEEISTSGFLEKYQETSIAFKDGRYSAKLPWRQDHPPLPDNYNITRRRTENTILRLSQEPTLLQKYGGIIADQVKRGFIEKVQDDNTTQSVHYIPHHGVKKDSATTPIRIVYDCSCRQTRDSPSLNDCLQSTPPELNDLTSILMRFRLNKYSVSTDIEKAFLHVQLDEKDRDFTRFLWLSDPRNPDSELMNYRFKVALFGATCSPFILNATLLKHLDDNIGGDPSLKKTKTFTRKDILLIF